VRLTRYDDVPWQTRSKASQGAPVGGGGTDRPRAGTQIKPLHQGERGRPGYYEMVVSRYPAAKPYRRHRHAVDQLRYTLAGESPWEPGRATGVGSLLYVPAGTYYGPYERPAGVELMAVQFEGADRTPFEDGPVGDDRFPPGPSRFSTAIELNPAAFAWQEIGSGARVKELATFTERRTRLAMLALGPDGRHECTATQRTLLFVTAGSGAVDGRPVRERDAVALEVGESIELSTPAAVELLVLGLPLLTD
jgi:hypothetical protein